MAYGFTFKAFKQRLLAAFERDYIVTMLDQHEGNISRAAQAADIDRKYFRRLMEEHGIGERGSDDASWIPAELLIPYDQHRCLHRGDLIRHLTFGVGYVFRAERARVEVAFTDGVRRVLTHSLGVD